MIKRISLVLATLLLAISAPLVSRAQQQEPPTYTMVSEWVIPRAQWTEYEAFIKKNTQPVLEKFQADGTILSWGMYATVVHQEERETHGSWFETSSLANIQKVLADIAKLAPNPIINTVKHHDFLLRAPLRRSRAASASTGYLLVNSTQLQPGKGQEWRALFDKYNKPVYDELLANGTISAYWVHVEQVHTDDPGRRYVVYVVPNADGLDKVGAAFQAAGQKRGAEANQAVGRAFTDVSVAGAHRDYFARIINYGQK
jgi:hypothetical protein